MSDKGRKLRLAGRGRDGAGLTTARVGAMGVNGMTSIRGDSCFSESSSSSSSSTRVWSWSLEDDDDAKCLKESRLLPSMVLSPVPKLAPEPGGKEGFVALQIKIDKFI